MYIPVLSISVLFCHTYISCLVFRCSFGISLFVCIMHSRFLLIIACVLHFMSCAAENLNLRYDQVDFTNFRAKEKQSKILHYTKAVAAPLTVC